MSYSDTLHYSQNLTKLKYTFKEKEHQWGLLNLKK